MAIVFRPYLERLATNVSGVAVGYSPILVNLLSSRPSEDEDYDLALFGAVLIPVVGRLAGSQNRRHASVGIRRIIAWSSVLLTAVAIAGCGLIVLGRRGHPEPAAPLAWVRTACWGFLAVGLILDLLLVAAERERHEPRFETTIRGVLARVRQDLSW